MKRLALSAVAALAMMSGAATAEENHNLIQLTPLSKVLERHVPATCKAPAFRRFSARVWNHDRWERGQPKRATIRAQRHRLRCAPPGHRRAMRHRWRTDKRAYYRHRREQLADWCAPRPHPEGDGCWTIPAWCVYRESGGSWTAHNPTSPARGPYQLLGHGEPWPVTTRAQAMEHHRLAAHFYATLGLQPWVAC